MSKERKKNWRFPVLLTVFLLALALIPQIDVSAHDSDGLTLKDGVLSWSAVESAAKYEVNINNTFSRTYGETFTVTSTSFDVHAIMKNDKTYRSGDYYLTVTAKRSSGIEIKTMQMIYYNFEAGFPQLDTPQPRFNGTVVEWEPIAHADRYYCKIGISTSSTGNSDTYHGEGVNGVTSVDISEYIEPDLYYKIYLTAYSNGDYVSSDEGWSERVLGQNLLDGYTSPLKFSGTISVDKSKVVAGETLHATVTGVSSSISASLIRYKWEMQERLENGNFSFYKTVKDSADPYFQVPGNATSVRVYAYAEGYNGTTEYSNDIFVISGVAINSDTFPDSVFRAYIKDNFDKNPKDDKLTESEINNIRQINVGWKGITTLKGIEYLYNVMSVYAYHNDIVDADFSTMPYLLTLDLSENDKLKSLNVTNNKYLRHLYIQDSGLENVDLSGNPLLYNLETYRSKISKLDIRNNPVLVDALLHGEKSESYYEGYKLNSGDLKISSSTTVLLVSLDEDHFPSEEFRKQIAKDYDWNNDDILSDWEVLAVEKLFPEDSEDLIRTLQGIEYFPNLTYLSAFNCRIPYVDLSQNKKLTHVDLGGNRLKALDISMLQDLDDLDVCNNSDLGTLDVSNNPKLISLWCWGCGLSSLDLSANTKLVDLQCAENQITELNVSGLTGLTSLACDDNPIETLGVSNNKKLKTLSLGNTKINKLDVSACSDLYSLSCSNTGLTTIDVSKNEGLSRLSINGSKIKTLDISNNERIKSAYAGKKSVRTNSVTGATWDNYISEENNSWWLNIDADTKVVTEKEHSWDAGVVSKEATCKEKGIKTYTCTTCGETKTEEIELKPHTLTKVPAKAATETEEGNKEYYICSVCNKWFEDAEGTKEITDHNSVIIPKSGTATPTPDITRDTNDISQSNPVKLDEIEKTILNKKDEKDTKGSTFTLLKAKGTPKSKKSIKLSWSKVPGAEEYIIYGNKCGKKNKYKKIATVKGTSYTAKKLKKGTYYKYTIVAVKGDEAIATSKTIHVVTDGGKKGNNTKVKLSKTKLSLTAGKSKKIKATLKYNKKVATHRKVAWESDNVSIATVKNGKITAVGKGTCYVYAYAQNGVSAKIKVTVK